MCNQKERDPIHPHMDDRTPDADQTYPDLFSHTQTSHYPNGHWTGTADPFSKHSEGQFRPHHTPFANWNT
jgi:hypothetical protein